MANEEEPDYFVCGTEDWWCALRSGHAKGERR